MTLSDGSSVSLLARHLVKSVWSTIDFASQEMLTVTWGRHPLFWRPSGRNQGSLSLMKRCFDAFLDLLIGPRIVVRSPLDASEVRERLTESVDLRASLFRHVLPEARGRRWVAGSLGRRRVKLWIERALWSHSWRAIIDVELKGNDDGSVLRGRVRMHYWTLIFEKILLAFAGGMIVGVSFSWARAESPLEVALAVAGISAFALAVTVVGRMFSARERAYLLDFLRETVEAGPQVAPSTRTRAVGDSFARLPPLPPNDPQSVSFPPSRNYARMMVAALFGWSVVATMLAATPLRDETSSRTNLIVHLVLFALYMPPVLLIFRCIRDVAVARAVRRLATLVGIFFSLFFGSIGAELFRKAGLGRGLLWIQRVLAAGVFLASVLPFRQLSR